MAREPRRLARGTNAQVLAYTGPSGEPIFNIETKRLHIQDGITAGGVAMLRADEALDSHGAPSVATRSGLKALDIAKYATALLTEAGREGLFVLKTGTNPVADARAGVYIVSNTAGYYWERAFEGDIFVEWFGAVGDDTTDNQPAYDAAKAILDATGYGTLRWGPGVFRQSGTNLSLREAERRSPALAAMRRP